MQDNVRAGSELSHARAAPLFSGHTEENAERRSSVEWAASSLTLGGVFALMAPVGLLLAHILQADGYRGFSPSDKRLAALGGYGSVFLILSLAIVGLVFGIVSISASRRERRPIALGLAGVLLNGLDLFMWLGAGLAWHSSAWNLL